MLNVECQLMIVRSKRLIVNVWLLTTKGYIPIVFLGVLCVLAVNLYLELET